MKIIPTWNLVLFASQPIYLLSISSFASPYLITAVASLIIQFTKMSDTEDGTIVIAVNQLGQQLITFITTKAVRVPCTVRHITKYGQ